MRTRTFAGTPVGAVGLGCMPMSWAYNLAERDDEASVALIREAVELGVTFLDTADVYGLGHNETLVGRALSGLRDRVVLATKVGLRPEPGGAMGRDGSPGHVRAGAEESLRRLGTDVIDLYYLHRVDPRVPLAETWGAMAELVAEGKVRWLGLSEVTVAQAEEAHAIHPVAAVQSEMSLWTRDPMGVPGGTAGGAPGAGALAAEGPGDVVGWCAAHGAAFVPFSPLGRGFLTGTVTSADFDDKDFRSRNPRFQEEALRQNMRIVDVVRRVAERRGATPAQVAIAWVLAQGEHVIPIPGTKKVRYLRENAAAADLDLTAEDLAELDALPAPVGGRY
ncbi:aldo/keto reductase [Thermomonospora cellulosilytica]|uniref:Aryl-alcohol dehydrogenase-like predicted oxidoreductase n=1 Tax=Thermomonospora cellulosilytica TaxID=1411118 RepID=A0A7W3N2G1_9ACTN|nr:aldo/keto reductase [Thermomonospora cellulosilytica]MBA9006282.1 aryl-alcohol dehydrogenase-like predicted oxidoreductase [Thermomonospora cellulosilytica]